MDTPRDPDRRRDLRRRVLSRLLTGFVVIGALLFLSAGTLAYWEAWVYLGLLVLSLSGLVLYLLDRTPDLLERRMRLREREAPQKLIATLSGLVMLAAFALPGLDKRFGWSSIHPLVVIAADVTALLGYGLFAVVMMENRFASRTIEVDREQTVVTTGPYAVVRHPMYAAVLILCAAAPMALGSYVALAPVALLPLLLVARIRNEEAVLARDLAGYREYTRQTRYRLIPGVW